MSLAISAVQSPSNYRNILCIEEHGEMSILLAKMLSHSMCKILHIKDKTEAELYLENEGSILVIIENNFYENSGLTYAARLKSIFPAIKLMMLSSQSSLSEQAPQAGVDVFLVKPFTKSQLLESITALIDLPQDPGLSAV